MIVLTIFIEIIMLILIGVCWYQAEENCSILGGLGAFFFRNNVICNTNNYRKCTWLYKLYRKQ